MTSRDDSKIPKALPLASGKTLQSYPLAPVDGFVLSRVDGMLSIADIITLTGLDADSVHASMGKLAELGLVELGGGGRLPPPKSEPVKSGATIPPRPITEISEVTGEGAPKRPPALYDPAELDEETDLDLEHKRRILDTFYRLPELDLYQVLGVERTADKKTIKRAYYELAAIHHPDRFFRKKLGSFKQKMELVFSRVTEAHDTLIDKDRRAEYDGYLAAQKEARDIETRLERPTSPGMDRVEKPEATPPPPPPAETRTSGIQLSEQARRDSLARKLLGGRHTTPPPTPPPPDPDALRRHYDQKVSAVREHLIKDHLSVAERAKAAEDWVAASNAYRLALQVQPDDRALQQALAEVQSKANKVLADSYRKQAKYEEKSGRHEEAARSWQRVTRALPDDAESHGRAAACMLRAGIDLRNAATLAQRAIALKPTELEYRVTLAEVYLAAGHSLNARRELEAAAQLAPHDANIEALLKRAGKR